MLVSLLRTFVSQKISDGTVPGVEGAPPFPRSELLEEVLRYSNPLVAVLDLVRFPWV